MREKCQIKKLCSRWKNLPVLQLMSLLILRAMADQKNSVRTRLKQRFELGMQ